ncbi:MAG: MBL fold metallo-hydrolase [Syntrophomonadaceae bacterium]|nr:MBL fold metallo-hydrolase [Syntrophomonadaceae bacterium]
MEITWYGTNSVKIGDGETSLLFDPFLKFNPEAYQPPLDEFAATPYIFLTHGHVDHAYSIPEIMAYSRESVVYCTATPKRTLLKHGVDEACLREIAVGDTICIGAFEVRVLPGKHIKFDRTIVRKTLLNRRVWQYRCNFGRLFKAVFFTHPEKEETVVFHLRAHGKELLMFGSLSLKEDIAYPQGVDLLFLPFQGRTDITDCAVRVINALHPQRVFLTHFDDSFPPVSAQICTAELEGIMAARFDSTRLIKPEQGRCIAF